MQDVHARLSPCGLFLEIAVLLKVENLRTYYRQESKSLLDLLGLARERYVKAVDDVTFELPKRNTLGVVGESGCGKTTLAKAIIGLEKINNGKAEFLGFDITLPLRDRDVKLIREMQMVFQNPDSTLNPSHSVGKQIARPLKRFKIVPKDQIRTRAVEILRAVRLDAYYYDRLPRQLSGGEKQRVGIARALACRPDLIICDEPVSALDVSVQASVLNLLMDLQEEFGTTVIFIAHDLSVVRFLSDDIAVMYLGQIVELADTDKLFKSPLHPYTDALIQAVPIPDPKARTMKIVLPGEVPSPINPPSGCRFHPRCPYAQDICKKEDAPFEEIEPERFVACHFAEQLKGEITVDLE